MSSFKQIADLYHPGAIFDARPFEVGEIYYICDDLIVIPDADRVTIPRNFHEGRIVVIAHNNYQNADPTWPLISVAPLGHRVELMGETDIEVPKEDCAGLKYDSMIKLALVQPVLKVDLERRVGCISTDKIVEMLLLQRELLLGTSEEIEDE